MKQMPLRPETGNKKTEKERRGERKREEHTRKEKKRKENGVRIYECLLEVFFKNIK